MFTSLLNGLALTTSYNYNYTYTSPNQHVSGAALAIIWLVIVAVAIWMIVAMWKVYQKAGRPGWAAIVPIYNTWVMFEIGGKPGWLVLLSFVPIVNLVVIVFEIIVCLEIAKRFGKSGVFGFFLLFLLPFIGWPILAFGDAQYHGPSGVAGDVPSAPTPTDTPSTPPAVTQPPADAQPPAASVQ